MDVADYPSPQWGHGALEALNYDIEGDDDGAIFIAPPIPEKSPKRLRQRVIVTELDYSDDSQSISTSTSATSPRSADAIPSPTGSLYSKQPESPVAAVQSAKHIPSSNDDTKHRAQGFATSPRIPTRPPQRKAPTSAPPSPPSPTVSHPPQNKTPTVTLPTRPSQAKATDIRQSIDRSKVITPTPLVRQQSHPAAVNTRAPKRSFFSRIFDGVGQKATLGNPGEKGLTALHRAALKGDLDRVDFLLSDPAVTSASDINAKRRGCTGWEETVLHLAMVGGSAPVILRLLDAGADPDQTCMEDFHRLAPIHRAALDCSLPALNALLVHGADINRGDLHERTALHCAAGQGHVSAVDLLLHAGARIDHLASYWQTPLYHAVKHGRHEVVELLTSHGADLMRHSNDWNDNTLLHQAVLAACNNARSSHDSTSCLAILLQAGAPVDGLDKRGTTALHLAALRGSAGCVRLLLKHGADVTLVTDPPNAGETAGTLFKHTPLELALRAQGQGADGETVKILKQALAKREEWEMDRAASVWSGSGTGSSRAGRFAAFSVGSGGSSRRPSRMQR